MPRPTDEQIQDQIAEAEESVMEGNSQWPGMSYEEGVSAALRWAIGESQDRPMDE